VSAVVMIGVSYATEAPDPRRIEGLTYGTVTDEQRGETSDSWDRSDVSATILVLLGILLAYLYFS